MEQSMKDNINIRSAKYTLIFIILFVILNVINGIVVFSYGFNNYISPFEFIFFGFINGVIADITVLLMFVMIIMLIFRRKIILYVSLITLTFFLNLWVVQVYVYSSFFQAVQTTRLTIQTLSNPAEGVWQAVVESMLRLIFFEFRFLFFTPTVVLIIFYFIFNKKTNKETENTFNVTLKRRGIIFLTATFIWIITMLITSSMINNSTKATFDRPLFTIRNGGFFSFYLQDVLNVGIDEQDGVPLDASKFVDKFNTNVGQDYGFRYFNDLAQAYFYTRDNQTDLFSDKNVFIIQVEAFQNFLIGANINGKYVTPFMNSLANLNNGNRGQLKIDQREANAQTFYFSNVMQSVGRGNTNDAELSVLTGLYGLHDDRLLQTFEMNNGIASFDFDSLPRLFQNTHETSFYHGNIDVFYNRGETFEYLFEFYNLNFMPQFVKSKGFDCVSQVPQRYLYKSWINDRSMLEFAINNAYDFLERTYNDYYMRDNFFNFITLVQPHAPFLNRGYIPQIDWGRDINNHIHLSSYLNTVHYIDKVLEEMITKAMYKLPNTLFVLYGDHGMTGNIRGNTLNDLLNVNSTIQVTRELLRVPVIFIENPPLNEDSNWQGRISDSLNGMDFEDNSNLVRSKRDIYRTILNMFDKWEYADEVFGVNMFTYEPSIAMAIRASYFKTDSFFAPFRNNNRILFFECYITNEEIKRERQVVINHRNMNLYFIHSRRST